ncbi:MULTISPECIES: uracil-DNA glycosylase family protein [Marichromatium]|uniref:Uracil-DNA glycosylase n=1 Tax=Marichromatium gracile TaxID=1048 RepID=A0A4R4A5Z0_MARGR|nr:MULTISPECIES: uracil-DNA glycosylase family protein [Marichromatium]MBK1709626.1 uracil-DNA glycosylase [Marichromatium gracile]RNE90945.1 uracil-DNA glycosylase [Marichromatium sp. AB31]TCW34034.1 uracil-DNA glycosylase [Marichromatium gracile]
MSSTPFTVAADAAPADRLAALTRLHHALEDCRRCPAMFGPSVHSATLISPVMLVGQAPGTREIEQGLPFCWTAGKTLFRWLGSIGMDEPVCRERLLISAVCRCFPGKNPKGGDRVPDGEEIARCAEWWRGELALLRPRLIIPVGKLAIAQLMDFKRLNEVVGQQWRYRDPAGWEADMIPLPHSSGASTWFKMEPGKTLLAEALALIEAHPAWRALRADHSLVVK